MGSKSETGHAKNLAAFASLNEGITTIGSTYAPSNTQLHPNAITELLNKSTTAAKDLKDAAAPYDAAIKARQAAYKPLSTLVGRIVGIFEISDTPINVRENLRSLAHIIQGKNAAGGSSANKKAHTDGTVSEGHSSSQMSFDQRVDHFNEFLALLTQHPGYAPTEHDLRLNTLAGYAAELHAANQAVIATSMPYVSTLAFRNNLFYSPETGLTDTGRKVKKYLLKAFGPKSAQYATVKSLRFTDIG